MGQAAEIQGIIAALAPVLRAEARIVGEDRAAPFVTLAASRAATRAGGPLVAAFYGRSDAPDGSGDATATCVDVTPEPGSTPGTGSNAEPTGRNRRAARLAEAARPAVDRLAAMVLGTGLSSFSLTVRLAEDAAAAPRLEVVRATVEGFDVVEATAAWSWQNRFRDSEPAALAIALVMQALASADDGVDRDAMVPHDIRPDADGDAAGDADGAAHRPDGPRTARETGIERALRPCLVIEGIDANHVLRRHAAWLRGMRQATGRDAFAEAACGRAVVTLRPAGEAAPRTDADLRLPAEDADHPQPSRHRPLAAAE